MCNWFFIAKCIGHYVLDFVLANVLLAGWAGCWLFAAFAFFFLFHFHLISFHFIPYLLSCYFRRWNGSVFESGSMARLSRSYSFWNRNWSKFEVSKGIKHSQKIDPQKGWTTLFTIYPLLITSGSELTLFTFPLPIATGHYRMFCASV